MRERRRAMKAAAALWLAAVLLVGACTNADSDGSGSDGGTGSTGDTAAAGDSTGVTDDTIKIGWPMLDQAALVEAGLATDFGDLIGLAQEIVDDWNADGGINGRAGRAGEPHLRHRHRQPAPGHAAGVPRADRGREGLRHGRLQLVRRRRHLPRRRPRHAARRPDLAGPAPCSTPATATSSSPTSCGRTRCAARCAWSTSPASSTTSRSIGVFGPLEPGMREAIDDGLAPALEEAGTELADDGTIPFSASPRRRRGRRRRQPVQGRRASTPCSPLGNFFFNGAFMTEAEKQDYHPTYVMSDLSEGTDDLILKFAPAAQLDQRDRGELEGQVARPGADRRRTRRASTTYAPTAEGGDPAGRRRADVRAPRARCARASRAPATTRPAAASSRRMEGIGAFTTSGGGTGSYGPDNHTMPDQVRLVRFDLEGCECWAAEGDWVDVDD